MFRLSHALLTPQDVAYPDINLCPYLVSVTLRLTHSAQTLELWPHKFEFDITIGLLAPEAQHSPSLHMQLAVFNRSEEEFNFTCAFHTYFTVPDVTQVAITPLQQHTYFDKLTISDSTQESPVVSIVGETDRVYHKYVTTTRLPSFVVANLGPCPLHSLSIFALTF